MINKFYHPNEVKEIRARASINGFAVGVFLSGTFFLIVKLIFHV